MSRCANPECGRAVVKHPVTVVVRGTTLVYGLTCAKRAGLLPPKPRTTRRYAVATPRPIAEPAVEPLPGEIPLWTDDEGIEQ